MPKAAPAEQLPVQTTPIVALGRMLGDGFTLPHYNSSATLSFFPGEPFLKTQGSGAVVAIAPRLIRPGEWAEVQRVFLAEFPCDFSADIKDGDEVYWDLDNEVVSLAADVTNGFSLGYASYLVKPGQAVTAVADDRVVVATSSSTHVVVASGGHASTTKGTVTIYGATAAKAAKATKSK